MLIEQEALSAKGDPDRRPGCRLQLPRLGFYGRPVRRRLGRRGTILADNGYVVVDEPREGDIVIYRDGLGQVQHTGLVRFVGTDGLVLVESKWGSLGIYLHTPKEQPYGEFFNFSPQFPSGPRVASERPVSRPDAR